MVRDKTNLNTGGTRAVRLEVKFQQSAMSFGMVTVPFYVCRSWNSERDSLAGSIQPDHHGHVLPPFTTGLLQVAPRTDGTTAVPELLTVCPSNGPLSLVECVVPSPQW